MKLARVKIFIIVGFVICLFVYLVAQVRSQVQRIDRMDGYQPIQPIAFSHKVHAGDNEIPCLYCHYAAERGRTAGIPAASVCMNCHSIIKKDSEEVQKVALGIEKNTPIEWIKVHRLSDFVYFNHAQHVRVGKLSCQSCHGAVEKMARVKQEEEMSMGWCIDCHRNSNVIGHDEKLGIQKVSQAGGLDCAKCHY